MYHSRYVTREIVVKVYSSRCTHIDNNTIISLTLTEIRNDVSLFTPVSWINVSQWSQKSNNSNKSEIILFPKTITSDKNWIEFFVKFSI